MALADGMCSGEHMPDSCPILQEANQSRRRAWRELQRVRALLKVAVSDLPPPARPANFEKEGELLRRALARLLIDQWQRIERLRAAVEAFRHAAIANGAFTQSQAALLELNRELMKLADLLPAPKTIEAYRKESGLLQ
jgi:hypothetical protein